MATQTAQISLEDFRVGLLENFEEAFENVNGIFLDKGTSMFETLATISAEEASKPVGGGCANFAAQVNHTCFYMGLIVQDGRGEKIGKIDWDATWDVGEVDEAEWQRLIDQLHDAYEEVKVFVSSFERWDEDFIGSAFGTLAHCAYHLGEIRAGLCVVKGNRDKCA